MTALAFGFSSCSQEDEPKYQAPNPATFTVNVPGLQDNEIVCGSEMTDNATFNLFCSQPEYGYSAICSYYALASLDPECPDDEEKSVKLSNTLPTQSAMAIKTYELAAAINKLRGITSQEEFDKDPVKNAGPWKVYLRAVCEIEGIEGSRVVSHNVVSYNNVVIPYAEKKPAWIYICGDVMTLDKSAKNNFLAPGASNLNTYIENWSLYEPKQFIGDKIFAGSFLITPKAKEEGKSFAEQCSQFRFFYELLGWKKDASLSSNPNDFYCLPIPEDGFIATPESTYKFEGDVVPQGLGNWGIWTESEIPFTVVVDQKLNKIYIHSGIYVESGECNITFDGRVPTFE